MRDVGYDMLSAGLSFAGAMRDQQRDARAAEAAEREKQIETHAAKLLKDESYLKQIPESDQFAAASKAAELRGKQIQNDAAYRKFKSEQFGQDQQELQQNLQGINALLDKKDYKSAVPLMQQAYKLVKDGWDVQNVQWEDEATNTPGKVMFKNHYTGDEREEPLTEGNIRKSAQYLETYAKDPGLNSKMAAQDAAWWAQWNREQKAKPRVYVDADGNKMGEVIETVGKDEKGNFDPNKRQLLIFKKNEGFRPLDSIPEGWHTVEDIENKGKAAKSRADVAVAGANVATAELNKAKTRAILGGGVNQPDYRNAWQGNDGKWYAETLGGTVEIDPSKAKQETMHVLGGLQTNPETGEAQVAVQKGNKITAQTIEGMKVGSKEKDMVAIQQPDGTSTAMTRSQAMRELKDLSSMVTVPEAKQSLASLLSGGDTMDESQRTSRIAAISKAAASGTPEERAYAAQALAIAGSLWPSTKKSQDSPVGGLLKRAKEYQTTGLN